MSGTAEGTEAASSKVACQACQARGYSPTAAEQGAALQQQSRGQPYSSRAGGSPTAAEQGEQGVALQQQSRG